MIPTLIMIIVFSSGSYEVGKASPEQCQSIIGAIAQGRTVIAENHDSKRQEEVREVVCVTQKQIDEAMQQAGL